MKFGGIVHLCRPFSYPHPNFAGVITGAFSVSCDIETICNHY